MKIETTGKNRIFGSPKKLVLAACFPVRGVVARLALADVAALPGGPPVSMQLSNVFMKNIFDKIFFHRIMI